MKKDTKKEEGRIKSWFPDCVLQMFRQLPSLSASRCAVWGDVVGPECWNAHKLLLSLYLEWRFVERDWEAASITPNYLWHDGWGPCCPCSDQSVPPSYCKTHICEVLERGHMLKWEEPGTSVHWVGWGEADHTAAGGEQDNSWGCLLAHTRRRREMSCCLERRFPNASKQEIANLILALLRIPERS